MHESDWHGRRVLLTGHTGFKGAWMTQVLRRAGAQVFGLSLDPEPGALFTAAGLSADCAWDGRGDLRDAEVVRAAWARAGPDVVFHLAAESLVRRAFRTPAETFATNVMGSVHLVEAARDAAFEGPIVLVTTDKVYADDGRERGYSTWDRLGGTDPYSASKAACELVADTWRHSYGLRIATVRAGNVIGGGDVCEARLLPDCVRAWRRGEAVQLRRPDATRPWQHVLDPLVGYLRVADAIIEDAAHARAWNLGPVGPAWTVAEVLDEAVQHWPGATWEARPDPDGPTEQNRLDLDVAETVEALSWRPRWDTREAIRRTIQWEAAVHAGADPRSRCHADLDAFARPRALGVRVMGVTSSHECQGDGGNT